MSEFLYKTARSLFFASLLVAVNTITFTSCIKKSFDAPPDQNKVDPNLPVNLSLAQLQSIALASGVGRQIVGDSTVYGIVTLDDRTGNIYKEIVIQDSTGGMTLLLDRTYLYNNYPVGRKVYVKLKGLYIGTYHGSPELGSQLSSTGSILAIPSTLISSYVIGATYPNTVTPLEVTLAQICTGNTQFYYNKLIKINDVEFVKADAGQVYATPGILSSSTNLSIEDCPRVYTLNIHDYGYSTFQAALTPTGLGSITGVYQWYSSAGELLIEDSTSVSMTGTRCPNTVSLPSAGTTLSIDSLHKIGADLIKGAGLILDSFLIHGVVTASYLDSGNFTKLNYVIQDGNYGIALVYSSNVYPFHVGDSMKVSVNGDSLVNNNGVLQIRNISRGTNIAGTPYPIYNVNAQVMTIASLIGLYNVSDLQYTLVTIQNCTASPGGVYGGSQTLDDGSGKTLTLVTAPGASFANVTVSTTAKTYTGIVSTDSLGNIQLQIRDLADVH